jgi:hypothetical protein
MCDNLINQITLDCLMNKEQYNRYIKNKITKNTSRQDQKFYKKRIVDLTRDLLSKPSVHEHEILADVKYSFDNYVRTCIHYFKSLDNNDILQEEYKGGDFDLIPTSDADLTCHSQLEADKLLMRSVKLENPLDKFVKKKLLKQAEEPIIPKQKDIDLTDPVLKNKGIIKKKKKENIL